MSNFRLFAYNFIKLSIRSDFIRFKMTAFWLFLEPILYFVLYFILLEGRFLIHEKTFTELCIEVSAWLFFVKNFTQNANIFGTSKKFISALNIRIEKIFILQFVSGSISTFLYLLVFAVAASQSNFSFSGIATVVIGAITLILLTFCFSSISSFSIVYFHDFSKIIPIVVLGMLFTSGIFFQMPAEHTIVNVFFEHNPLRVVISFIYSQSLTTKHAFLLSMFILAGLSSFTYFFIKQNQASIRNKVIMGI